MLTAHPRIRAAIGIVLALVGVVWVLQGFDLLGQVGGMNGRGEWIAIGAATVVLGLALAASGVRRPD